MGLLDNLQDNVAELCEDVVNAVVEVGSDVIETSGNIFEDFCQIVAGRIDHIPGIGTFLGTVFRWIGAVVSGVFDLFASIIKGAGSIIAGVLGGLIRIIGGILTFSRRLSNKGLLRILSGIAGAILIVGGKLLSLVQTAIFVESFERRLTDKEKQILIRVFKNSLALYNLRIVDGRSGLFGINSRPFVLGNRIYMKGIDTMLNQDIFVHESTHVWQHQHFGSRYASDALGAQLFAKDPYNWRLEIQNGKTDWTNFNREAQAEFIQDIYLVGKLMRAGVPTDNSNGVFYDADGEKTSGLFIYDDYTEIADKAVKKMRSKSNFRLSRFIY